MKEAVIVAYGRSACCRANKGGFANSHPINYAAQTLKGVLSKVPQINPEIIGDVITGCAMPINEAHMNISRLIVNRAELPDCVPAQTINRFCSSGLQAISSAANAIISGEYDVAVAGGVESMSKCFIPYSDSYMNPWIKENYIGGYMSMGETAERVAEHYMIRREDMEKMALESHKKAAKARTEGKLAHCIIPVLNDQGNMIMIDEGILADENGMLKTSMERMAAMTPCFREEGQVTAATSSQMTDAAAYVVIMSSEKASELGIKPIAKFAGYSVAGCDATEMGMGPLFAVPKLMKKCNLSLEQMDVIEINEAFASQALACINELGMDMQKVNPYGGAMSIGHPMGATGAILTSKALSYLSDTGGQYALITMCIGGGMGAAGVFELCK
ncbi:thiolase family protein [Eubacteriaceae bacterium ES2]|jgi:acetyl-CoA acyltransferase|uniref:acetyl-CoA C-acyltransferase n=1 Tax=Acetobacterium wieringae TaxID=52694 RepID=A0A1F2PD25_9FIRM|nr:MULTISPECIES: thiolase family protein [Acetobacterium]AWW25926.1 acetyl-CoA C-acyltransferase [Acetobacterium sp. KB-1]OFV69153.1 3-ketoacyl-CoA thiolase [Acetobacterium wieringae]WKY46075.1 thiolase family protein [Eubacteriaceae bacterium ES2]